VLLKNIRRQYFYAKSFYNSLKINLKNDFFNRFLVPARWNHVGTKEKHVFIKRIFYYYGEISCFSQIAKKLTLEPLF